MSGLEILSTSLTSRGTASVPSLGRYAAATTMSSTANAFYDTVSTAQQDAHTTDYRCFVVFNNGTGASRNVKVKISTAPSQSTISIGADTTATGVITGILTIASPANETTAPTGITWTTGILDLGAIPDGSGKAVWIRRVALGTDGISPDTLTLKTYTY